MEKALEIKVVCDIDRSKLISSSNCDEYVKNELITAFSKHIVKNFRELPINYIIKTDAETNNIEYNMNFIIIDRKELERLRMIEYKFGHMINPNDL